MDDIKESAKKVKGKGFKYAFDYFWEYYKYPALAIVVGIIVLVSLIKTIVTAKPTEFEVAFINAYFTPSAEAVGEYLGIDLDKKSVYLDSSFQITTDDSGYSQTSYTSAQKLAAVVASKQVDAIICPPDIYELYQKSLFYDLREFYTQEFLDSLGDKVIYSEEYVNDSGETIPSRPQVIDITDAPQIMDNGVYPAGKKAYFAIISNTEHAEYARAFYEFLYTPVVIPEN